MCTDSETGVEEQDPTIGPGCEETAFVGWWSEGGIVVFEGDVDIFE